ncbi:hypothetical protein [Roseateles sp. BYS87W]|uniref:Uncharacterized protein n=1 Tax=Pelomonas baiyunensis TaxID=3299026 RepID=A0ABW7GZN4_9BURK
MKPAGSSRWHALAIFWVAVLAFAALFAWWTGMSFWISGLIWVAAIAVNGFVAAVEDGDFRRDKTPDTSDD